MPSAQHLPLSVAALRRTRQAARFGGVMHYFDSIDSTNTAARRLALDGATEGTVVIAETQTKGRGRLGRAWVSPPFRNLYLSIIVRPPIATADAPQLVLVAGLAVAETVREWTARAAIKWPNDVLVDGRKVAGILTEMDDDDDRVRFVIIGIGVNLNSVATDFPPELRDKAVGLCTAVGAPIDRVAFTDHLLSRLEERYELFVHQGFAAVGPLWEGLSCLTGKPVEVDDGYRRYAGVAVGIAGDGSLRLRDATGSEIRVVVGDVTVVGGYDGA
ncbi:MAG TPA: biotin--[acetyl-CoA-carboxylase] ligase [Candidatus Acidoferrales bacterium]|nr:biotin--[acetyl-CoA-carboxylase] ligase [Candidatus Acidoferrales bacterium]